MDIISSLINEEENLGVRVGKNLFYQKSLLFSLTGRNLEKSSDVIISILLFIFICSSVCYVTGNSLV